MQIKKFDACPACAKRSSRTLFIPDDTAWEQFLLLSKSKYQGYMDTWADYLSLEVRQCSECGHLWHHTQPDSSSLLGMYQAGVRSTEKDPARQPNDKILHKMASLYKLAASTGVKPLTLLDYGSGFGRWSSAAAMVGFRVHAFEPSAFRAGRSCGNFQVVNNLEELTGKRFDVVNIEQVLEHTQEPLKVLFDLSCFLTPHSLLRISVPNLKRIPWAMRGFPFDGKRVHIMSPYEHLHGFTPTSLASLIKRAGLVPVRTFAAWRTHPLYQIRCLLGCALPHISTTLSIVKPG